MRKKSHFFKPWNIYYNPLLVWDGSQIYGGQIALEEKNMGYFVFEGRLPSARASQPSLYTG